MPRRKAIGSQLTATTGSGAGDRNLPARRRDARQSVLVLVERPRRWGPQCEWDMPRRAVVIEVVARPATDPATYVRQYNALSLDESGTTWAAWVPAMPTIGAEAELLALIAGGGL
jgi:hypothetical protein